MKLIRKETTAISRREFLKLLLGTSLAYILAESVFFLVTVEAAKHIGISEHTIYSPKLDQKWDNTFIVHFSDMHISSRGSDFINPGVIEELSIQISEYLKAVAADRDKTFFIDTGDMVSSRTATGRSTPIQDLSESLSYITRIPAAKYFVSPGNHEFGHENTQQVFSTIQSAGMKIIGVRASSIISDDALPFLLVGLPDFTTQAQQWYESYSASDSITQINQNSNLPVVVASHTSIADVWDGGRLEDELSGVLFLHGHTHGGQVGPNSPIQFAVSQYALHHYKYLSKYYRGVQQVGVNQENLVSVSSGIGHAVGHRVRTAKPEVVIYRLRSA